MNPVPLIALAIALYLALLVIVGWRPDRRASEPVWPSRKTWVRSPISWRRGHARGAIAGVSAGFAVWLVAIAGPAFAQGDGLGLGRALWPVAAMPWANVAIALSLMTNTAYFVVFSLRAQPRLIDDIQANSFVLQPAAPGQGLRPEIGATVGDLRRLLAQFLGRAEANRTLAEFARQARSMRPDDVQPVSAAMERAQPPGLRLSGRDPLQGQWRH